MSVTLEGGPAYFVILVMLMLTAYLILWIWTLIRGGTLDLSFSSKGAIPQIKQMIALRRQRKAEIAELRAKFNADIEDIHQQNPNIKITITVKKFKEAKRSWMDYLLNLMGKKR